jgi:histidinol-phosphate aminotransferase
VADRLEIPAGVLRPREAVLRMAPYSPPTGGRAGKLRLDFNENTRLFTRVIESQTEADRGSAAVYPEHRGRRTDGFSGVLKTNSLDERHDEAIQVIVNTYGRWR